MSDCSGHLTEKGTIIALVTAGTSDGSKQIVEFDEEDLSYKIIENFGRDEAKFQDKKRKLLKKLASVRFNWDKSQPGGEQLITRGLIELHNGDEYEGQWNSMG